MTLDLAAQSQPVTFVGQLHSYICHTAAIYWAWRVSGCSPLKAAQMTDRLACLICSKCTGGDQRGHAAGQHDRYAALMCEYAVPLKPAETRAGDVIIVGSKKYTTHTMICVQSGNTGIFVRAYNNYLTFRNYNPQPPQNAYDPVARDLSMRLGHDPLLRIPGEKYISAVLTAGL